VAISRATRDHPGLRVAYVDIDAHHGDGVQEAFYERADVLTLSVHESGSYLYPGTGDPSDIGTGEGEGLALNVPLPPEAGPECYDLVFAGVIAPALRAFRPEVIVLQGGGDSHRDDPLTHLDNTVAGFVDTVAGIVRLAEELCHGRLVMTGGGGYEPYSAVPRMWACAMAELLGADTPATVPDMWLRMSHAASRGTAAPLATAMTLMESTPPPPDEVVAVVSEVTRRVVEDLRSSHPLLAI
jgi:acetoin utilization protein AcuC